SSFPYPLFHRNHSPTTSLYTLSLHDALPIFIMRRRPMPDRLAAYVRTYWPMVLGHVATALAAWLGTRLGVSVDSVVAYELIALTASAGVYALGRWLEAR